MLDVVKLALSLKQEDNIIDEFARVDTRIYAVLAPAWNSICNS